MTMQILSNIELKGGLTFTLDADFPADPALGMLWMKDGCVYLYGKIGNLETWYPFASKTNSYVHVQGLPALTWTVQHNLGVADVWYQVKNADGQIIQAPSEVVDSNTLIINFTTAVVGTVVVVAPDTINVPQVKASIIDVASGVVVIDSSGVKVNGLPVLTSASISAEIAAAVAPKADASAVASSIATLSTHISGKLNLAGDPAQNVAVNQLTTAGGIVPTTAGQSIGSPTQRFASIYVDEAHLSTNTLYIGDTPILGTDADTVQIKTDVNQHISIETSGTGTTTIVSERGITMSTAGLNADVVVQASGAGAKVRLGATQNVEFTAPEAVFSGNQTVAGNLTVQGDVFFQGSSVEVSSTQVTTKDNVIVLNEGEPGSGVTAGIAGIQIDRGDAAAAQIIFRESDDFWCLGQVGGLEIVATRPWADLAFTSIAHAGAGGVAHADATTSTSGFMSAGDKTKLDGVATGATANATDAQLRDRSTHTGTQAASTISDFSNAVSLFAPVKTVAGVQPNGAGDVSLVKSSVGLGNVDNTSDLSKPVSTAQAAADTVVATSAAADATSKANAAQNYAIARANHTGTQAISTVSGLQTVLDAKATQAELTSLTSRVAILENLLTNGTVKYDGRVTV